MDFQTWPATEEAIACRPHLYSGQHGDDAAADGANVRLGPRACGWSSRRPELLAKALQRVVRRAQLRHQLPDDCPTRPAAATATTSATQQLWRCHSPRRARFAVPALGRSEAITPERDPMHARQKIGPSVLLCVCPSAPRPIPTPIPAPIPPCHTCSRRWPSRPRPCPCRPL
jgi:hypothetical protein